MFSQWRSSRDLATGPSPRRCRGPRGSGPLCPCGYSRLVAPVGDSDTYAVSLSVTLCVSGSVTEPWCGSARLLPMRGKQHAVPASPAGGIAVVVADLLTASDESQQLSATRRRPTCAYSAASAQTMMVPSSGEIAVCQQATRQQLKARLLLPRNRGCLRGDCRRSRNFCLRTDAATPRRRRDHGSPRYRFCSWSTANGAIAMPTKEASAGPSFGDSYATEGNASGDRR